MEWTSEVREPPRRRLSLLPALIGATVLLAVGYWFVKDAPNSPGDWLLLLRNQDLSARHSPPGIGFAWLVDVLELWRHDPAWLRLFGFIACLVGVGLLAARIARTADVDDNRLVVLVAALAAIPWLFPSPNALSGLGRFGAVLFVGLAAWAQVLRWERSFPLLAVLGFLAGAAAGPHVAYGTAILLVALMPRRELQELVPVLGFVAAAWATRFAGTATIPAPQTWWVDVGIVGSFDTDLSQALLAAVGLGILVASMRQTRRIALPWSAGVLVVAFVIALVNHRVETRRWQRSIRDEAILNQALAKMPALVPIYFLNLPIHVRPLVAVAYPDETTWRRITLLETWDTGAQVHLPGAWRIPFTASLCRWTKTGFDVLTWQQLLNVPNFPLAVIVGDEPPVFRTPWQMVTAGTLATGKTRKVESYDDQTGGKTEIRVQVGAGPEGRLAIAGIPTRSMKFSNRALTTPLIARWSLPTSTELQVKGGVPLALDSELPGYGPVFAIPSDALDCALPVPDSKL